MSRKSPLALTSGVVLATVLLGYGVGEMNSAHAQDSTKKQGTSDKGAPDGGKAPGKQADNTKKNPNKGAGKKGDPTTAKTATPGKGPQQGIATAPPAGGPGIPGAPKAPGAPGAKPGAPGTAPVAISLPKGKPGYDPFKITWHQLPPPPYIFDNIVGPVRVASVDVEVPPVGDITVREVPDRRVSGIMSGDGVFAILEGGDGQTDIVKPGSVTSDGYRVISITETGVKLEKKENNVIRTQDVPLTDQSLAGNLGGGLFGQGSSGVPGAGIPGSGGPGFMPGSGGPGAFPGTPGGGRGGRGRGGVGRPGVGGGGKGN